MKKIITILMVMALYAIPSLTYAQFDIISKSGEEPFKSFEFCPCNIPEDYDRTTRVLNALAEKERREQLQRIEGLIKDEIDRRFGKNFENFEDASKFLFKQNYGQRVAATALNTLYDEYISNYNSLRGRAQVLQLEKSILEIRRNELSGTSKLGWLKLNEDTYLKDLTTNSQINEQLNITNDKYDDVSNSFSTPRKIITGIRKLRENGKLEDVIADLHFNNYRGYGYSDKVRLMQAYLIEDLYIRGQIPGRGVVTRTYNPDPLRTDGSGEAYREALEEGTGTIDEPSFDDDEAIRRFAINSLGKETAEYLSNKNDLRDQVLSYLENKTYARTYLDCTYFLFDTFLGGLPFDADPNLYTPYLFNSTQSTEHPNRALRYSFTSNAINEGMEGFTNVLHEFQRFNSPDPAYFGRIINDMFVRNGISVSEEITNQQLGELFRFVRTENTSAGIDFVDNIGALLTENGITLTNVLTNPFALQAALAILNGGEVDIEEKIIKDPSFANTKADCVYEKLLKIKSFSTLIDNFTVGDPVSLDIKFKVAPIPTDNPFIKINATTSKPENGIITITINEKNLEDRPASALARTIIHEIIHAHIYRQLSDALNRGINYTTITPEDIKAAIENNVFPNLFEAYKKWGSDRYQHEIIADEYRGTIFEVLKEYDKSANSDQLYRDLAWQGLQETETYRALPDAEERRLESVQQDFESSGNKNCE